MKIKNKKVFLSGPMSDDPENYHVDRFALAHNRVRELGAIHVYDPAIEHLSHTKEMSDKLRHEDYMAMCLNELTMRVGWRDGAPSMLYDVVVQLPGWQTSPGACMEYQVAMACGIPCVALDDCE